MRQLADGVQQLRGWPRNAINVYLIGDVLIDAATRQGEKRIMRELAGQTLSAHALTHAQRVDQPGLDRIIQHAIDPLLQRHTGKRPGMHRSLSRLV